MKKSRKEFIKEAHNHACSEWKQKIEKEFPKLFKTTELVVGEWYKFIDKPEVIGCYKGNGVYYGFNDNLDWVYGGSMTIVDWWKPATSEEVESALIKEAKRRGFKKGVQLKCAYNDALSTYCGCYDFELKSVVDGKTEIACKNTGVYLFNGGKWATIVETITKEEAEKQLGKTII